MLISNRAKLETIREYGLETLVANQELEVARQAHADSFRPINQRSKEHPAVFDS